MRELKISRSKSKQYLNRKQLNKPIKRGESIAIPVDLLNHNMINPIFTGEKPTIIYEDDTFLIVDKPHNIHCHPLKYEESDNVMSFLRSENIFSVLNVNTEGLDRGLLFRLDKVTSGVLVFTKKQDIYSTVRADFNSIAKEKTYQALVEGKVEQVATLEEYMTSVGKKGAVMKISEFGERASLSVTPLRYDEIKDRTLVEVSLKTGVRHQIRCQLAHLGHPIIGDTLYGAQSSDRVYLHAYRYSFLLNNKMESFTSLNSLTL